MFNYNGRLKYTNIVIFDNRKVKLLTQLNIVEKLRQKNDRFFAAAL